MRLSPALTLLVAAALAGVPLNGASDETARDIRLPVTDTHFKQVSSYVETVPDADYRHASAAAYEAFHDLKFGIRIHWGLYSIWQLQHESWQFLQFSPAKKAAYERLAGTWNPTGFDADEWTRLFQDAGARFFTFTSKHHDGFSMFDTRTRVRERVDWTAAGGPRLAAGDAAYSIMDTPFHRDVVGELVKAAHDRGLKVDLYFSLPDWHDADFRPYNFHPLQIPDSARWAPNEVGKGKGKYGAQKPLLVPDPSPAEVARMMDRIHGQLRELLTRYGRIDMIGLDQWLGPVVWPQLKAVVKDLRTIQPDVMFRARGIGNYGDYFTPEGFVPGSKQNTGMPWFVIYPLGSTFSFDPVAEHYKGARWIVRTLADVIAKGGNLEIGIGPDAMGRFHPAAVTQMREAGAWMAAHAEAIYGTRARPGADWKEGEQVRFTRSKDGTTLYAFLLDWPGRQVTLHTIHGEKPPTVEWLGAPRSLPVQAGAQGVTIDLGSDQPAKTELAYVLRIQP